MWAIAIAPLRPALLGGVERDGYTTTDNISRQAPRMPRQGDNPIPAILPTTMPDHAMPTVLVAMVITHATIVLHEKALATIVLL